MRTGLLCKVLKVAFITFIATFLAGCLVVPIPVGVGDVIEGKKPEPDQIRILLEPDINKDRIIKVLGMPDFEWVEANLFAYHWEVSEGQMFWFLYGGSSVAGDIEQLASRYVLVIQFDATGHVIRYDLLKRPQLNTYGNMMRNWVAKPVPQKPIIPEGLKKLMEKES